MFWICSWWKKFRVCWQGHHFVLRFRLGHIRLKLLIDRFCIFPWKYDAVSHQLFLNLVLGCFDTVASREWYLPLFIAIAALFGIWGMSFSSNDSQNKHYSYPAENRYFSFHGQNVLRKSRQNIRHSEPKWLITSHCPLHEWKMQSLKSIYYRCSQSKIKLRQNFSINW